MFRIVITETPNQPVAGSEPPKEGTLALGTIERYAQTVDELNLQAVIRMINAATRKKRSDAKKLSPGVKAT